MFNAEEIQKMHSYCLSLTKDPDEAQDLLQTGFLKFYKNKGESLEYPKSYIYRIIKNQFIDDRRKANNWKYESIDQETPNSNVILFSPETLDDILVSKDETERILGYLNPNDRELLYLWAVEGYTVKNLAEILNLPKGTLLSKLHRIKKKLRLIIMPEKNAKTI